MTPEEHRLRLIYCGTIVIILIIVYCYAIESAEASRKASYSKRRAQYTSRLTREQWVQELLSGHEDQIFNEFRMRKAVFRRLLATLQTNAGVHSTRYVSAEEQLSTFLYYAHRGLSNRALQERFQRSGDTISKCVTFYSIVTITNACSGLYIRYSTH
jgi:hypothetical protein